MIYKNEREIVSVFKGNIPITAIYRGSKLVWQAVKSCFGAGFWVDTKPWLNNEAWRNN